MVRSWAFASGRDFGKGLSAGIAKGKSSTLNDDEAVCANRQTLSRHQRPNVLNNGQWRLDRSKLKKRGDGATT